MLSRILGRAVIFGCGGRAASAHAGKQTRTQVADTAHRLGLLPDDQT